MSIVEKANILIVEMSSHASHTQSNDRVLGSSGVLGFPVQGGQVQMHWLVHQLPDTDCSSRVQIRGLCSILVWWQEGKTAGVQWMISWARQGSEA